MLIHYLCKNKKIEYIFHFQVENIADSNYEKLPPERGLIE
jgi:hypothetical protein